MLLLVRKLSFACGALLVTLGASCDGQAPPASPAESLSYWAKRARFKAAIVGPHGRRQHNERYKALRQLEAIGSEAVPVLCKLAEDSSYDHARWAVEALANLGDTAQDAIPVVVKIARDSRRDDFVRLEALKALPELGLERVELTNVLGSVIGDPSSSPTLRHVAENGLRTHDERAYTDLVTLRRLVTEVKAGKLAARQLPRALPNLDASADALLRAAPSLVPMLEQIASAEAHDESLRIAAGRGLVRLGAEGARKLVNLLARNTTDEVVRQAWIIALGNATTAPDDAVAVLVEMARDKNASTALRIGAISAVGRLGNPTQVKPVLEESSSDDNAYIRAAAIEALGTIAIRANE